MTDQPAGPEHTDSTPGSGRHDRYGTRTPAGSDRYGTRKPAGRGRTRPATASGAGRRRPWLIVAAAAALSAMVGLTAWFAFAPADTPTPAKTISYDVIDAFHTLTRVSVVPDDSRDIRCAVQATSAQEAVVGFTEVTVPAQAGADATQPIRLSVDIRTTQLAASGHVESCWYIG